MRRASLLAALLLLLPSIAFAQQRPLALTVKSLDTGKTVHAPGLIVFHKGRIIALGAPDKVKLPKGAQNVPMPTFYVKPGIIDPNNQRGRDGSFSETATRLTPGFSAADAFDPFAKGFPEAARGGVTHIVFAPDGGGILAGKAILLSSGEQHLGVALRREVALFGSLDRSAYRSNYQPSSRSEAVIYIRRMFASARAGTLHPGSDYRTWRPDAEVLKTVLDRKLPLAMRVGTAGDALVALGLFRELKIRGILVGGNTVLHKIIRQIKQAGVPVILDPLSTSDNDRTLRLPSKFAKAGIPFVFSSRAPRTLESGLLGQAALCVLHGLPSKAAWSALTSTSAKIYRLPVGGVLKVGGEASFLIFAGDPASFTAPLASAVWSGTLDGQRLRGYMQAAASRGRGGRR